MSSEINYSIKYHMYAYIWLPRGRVRKMDYWNLCSRSDSELESVDVALLNLSLADGLAGAENLNVPELLDCIERWTSLVALNTKHWFASFEPTEDCPTENQFRMMSMVTLLQRDIGVHYSPSQISGPDDARDSRDSFIHGPLTGWGGTCSSLPVVLLAIGRRLGYPLYLVPTKLHYFLRWSDGNERFNIECAGFGYTSRSDEAYAQWPLKLSPEERVNGFYLQNLSPRQILAEFIGLRAHCFLDNLNFAEALRGYQHAARLNPYFDKHVGVVGMANRLLGRMARLYKTRAYSISELVDVVSPKPRSPSEEFLLTVAKYHLRRVADFHPERLPVFRDDTPKFQRSPFCKPEA